MINPLVNLSDLSALVVKCLSDYLCYGNLQEIRQTFFQ